MVDVVRRSRRIPAFEYLRERDRISVMFLNSFAGRTTATGR